MSMFTQGCQDELTRPLGQNQAAKDMKPGRTYLLHVMPGWVFAGAVVSADQDKLVLQDCKYIEGIHDKASIFGIAAAKSQEEFDKVVSRSYDLPSDLTVASGRVVLFLECAGRVLP